MVVNSLNLRSGLIYDLDKYKLTNFVVSKSNAKAHCIIRNQIEFGWTENVIILLKSKNAGVGKRHLAYSLMTELLEQNVEKNLLYITEDGAVTEQDFNKVEGLVVINLERIVLNEIMGKMVCEKIVEFYKKGKYIILTYNYDKIEDINRYGEMMADVIQVAKVAEIEEPEEALCKEIINCWMAEDGISDVDLMNPVVEEIIKQSQGSIREMEGRYLMEMAMLNSNMDEVKVKLELEDIINNEGLAITTYYLPGWDAVVFLTDEEVESGEDQGMEKMPYLEELAPYNEVIGEFVAEMIIPNWMSASNYLRENGLMSEFRVYRMEKAKVAMRLWLEDKGIHLAGILKE